MKNQRIKINIDRKPIDHQKTDELKSFGAVMAGFTTVTLPFYKKWWFWGGTGTAIIGAAIIGTYAFNYKAETKVPEKSEEKVIKAQPVTATAPAYDAFIKPAFKGFNVDFTSFIVTSGQEKLLQIPGGTQIRIPACHFLYADGSEVNGKVEIRYREMNDGVDFAICGIPMTYDSAGQKYLFESAGMCEIQGLKDGKPILINPVCPITIVQKTVAQGAKFNMYYLDTVARNWQYIGRPNWTREPSEIATNTVVKDTFIGNSAPTIAGKEMFSTTNINADESPEIAQLNSEIEKLKKNAPKAPKQYNSAKHTFNIVANITNYPELQPFANVKFEVDSLDKNFSPAIYNYNWGKAVIEEHECKCGKQNLSLSKGWIYQTTQHDTTGFEEGIQRKTSVQPLTWWQKFWLNVRSIFSRKSNKKPVAKKLRGRKNTFSETKNFQSGDSIVIIDMYGVKLVPVNMNDFNPIKKSIKNSDFITIQVYPILTGKEYDKAFAEFNNKLIEHNKLIAEKIVRIEQLRKEAEEQRKAQLEQWQKQQAMATANIQKVNNSPMHCGAVRNAFSAERFGIYNSDNPVRLSKTTQVTLNFEDKNGNEQYVDKAYLVIKNRNALMANYYSNCCNNILTYGTKDNNQLFVVLPDDYVGVMEQADFNRFETDKNCTIRLRISPNPIKDTEELKIFLGVTPAKEMAKNELAN